jgi:hypothetical protein
MDARGRPNRRRGVHPAPAGQPNPPEAGSTARSQAVAGPDLPRLSHAQPPEPRQGETMSSDDTGETGFPGFKWLEGLFELSLAGAKDMGDGWNDVWENATDPAGSYTFGRWARDIAQISLRSTRTLEKIAKYPIITAVGASPPWATIVVGKSGQSVSSRWVDLGRTIGPPGPVSTGLERLGKGSAEIGLEHVDVKLNRMRDRLQVSLINLKSLAKKKLPSGTYIGFAKQRGASGPPLAVIFVSYEE